jgi:hypothetical protein
VKKLFCSVYFFPAKIFSGILEKGNLSEKEKILAEKNSLSKKVFSLSKKGFPNVLAPNSEMTSLRSIFKV